MEHKVIGSQPASLETVAMARAPRRSRASAASSNNIQPPVNSLNSTQVQNYLLEAYDTYTEYDLYRLRNEIQQALNSMTNQQRAAFEQVLLSRVINNADTHFQRTVKFAVLFQLRDLLTEMLMQGGFRSRIHNGSYYRLYCYNRPFDYQQDDGLHVQVTRAADRPSIYNVVIQDNSRSISIRGAYNNIEEFLNSDECHSINRCLSDLVRRGFEYASDNIYIAYDAQYKESNFSFGTIASILNRFPAKNETSFPIENGVLENTKLIYLVNTDIKLEITLLLIEIGDYQKFHKALKEGMIIKKKIKGGKFAQVEVPSNLISNLRENLNNGGGRILPVTFEATICNPVRGLYRFWPKTIEIYTDRTLESHYVLRHELGHAAEREALITEVLHYLPDQQRAQFATDNNTDQQVFPEYRHYFHLAERIFAAGRRSQNSFVSSYAQTNPHEDLAETFSAVAAPNIIWDAIINARNFASDVFGFIDRNDQSSLILRHRMDFIFHKYLSGRIRSINDLVLINNHFAHVKFNPESWLRYAQYQLSRLNLYLMNYRYYNPRYIINSLREKPARFYAQLSLIPLAFGAYSVADYISHQEQKEKDRAAQVKAALDAERTLQETIINLRLAPSLEKYDKNYLYFILYKQDINTLYQEYINLMCFLGETDSKDVISLEKFREYFKQHRKARQLIVPRHVGPSSIILKQGEPLLIHAANHWQDVLKLPVVVQ